MPYMNTTELSMNQVCKATPVGFLPFLAFKRIPGKTVLIMEKL